MSFDNDNFEEVSKKIKGLSDDIEKMLDAYKSESNVNKKNEKEKEISALGRFLSDLRDKIGDTLMNAGRTIHTRTDEELEFESFIDDIELELTETDFDPVSIIDYMSSKKIAPKSNSLTEAEANLILLENFENTPSISKIILIHRANIALLLNKNLNNPKFVKHFIKGNELLLDETSLIRMLDKFKDYKKIEKKNLKFLCEFCSVNLDNVDKIKKYDYELKNLILNKEYPKSIEIVSPSLKEKIKLLNERNSLSSNEAFVQIAEKWLKLGLPDPQDKLKSQINAKIAQNFLSNSQEEKKDVNCNSDEVSLKIKPTAFNLKR